MAVVAAEIERTGRIRLYENGIMSVNLPISTQGRRRAMLAFDAPALADAIARPLQAHLAPVLLTESARSAADHRSIVLSCSRSCGS